jgi:hypothetical protein
MARKPAAPSSWAGRVPSGAMEPARASPVQNKAETGLPCDECTGGRRLPDRAWASSEPGATLSVGASMLPRTPSWMSRLGNLRWFLWRLRLRRRGLGNRAVKCRMMISTRLRCSPVALYRRNCVIDR